MDTGSFWLAISLFLLRLFRFFWFFLSFRISIIVSVHDWEFVFPLLLNIQKWFFLWYMNWLDLLFWLIHGLRLTTFFGLFLDICHLSLFHNDKGLRSPVCSLDGHLAFRKQVNLLALFSVENSDNSLAKP